MRILLIIAVPLAVVVFLLRAVIAARRAKAGSDHPDWEDDLDGSSHEGGKQ